MLLYFLKQKICYRLLYFHSDSSVQATVLSETRTVKQFLLQITVQIIDIVSAVVMWQ